MNNKEKPLVSILLAFYNDTRFVEQTIHSIKNQTYKNLELIVVDDCSPDKEESKKIEKLAEKYKFKLIKKDKNEGASKAFRTGFQASKGEYISVIAQDDYYELDKIEFQIAEIQKHSLDAIFCNGIIFEQNTKKKPKKFEDKEVLEAQVQGQDKVAELISARDDVNCLLTQGGLFSRRIMEELDWMRDKFLLDDWPFTIEVWRKYKTAYNPKVTFNYRLHDSNTHMNFWKWFPARMQVVANLISDEKKTDNLAIMFFNMANYFLKNKMYEQAYKVAVSSIIMAENDEYKRLSLNVISKIPSDKNSIYNKNLKNKLSVIIMKSSLGYKVYKLIMKTLITLIPVKKYRKKLREKIL